MATVLGQQKYANHLCTQNEILNTKLHTVSLQPIFSCNELLANTNPTYLCIHRMVHQLDRYQNALSSPGAQKNSWRHVSWHFSKETKDIGGQPG